MLRFYDSVITQVDVIGISMAEIVHPQDIAELAAVFKTQGNDSQHGQNHLLLTQFCITERERLREMCVCVFLYVAHDVCMRERVNDMFLLTFLVFDRRDPLKRNFVVRMRCAFTPSVRSIARCSNFKVHT